LIKFKKFKQELDNHADSYFWIQNGYKKANYLNEDYFLNSLAAEIEKKTIKQINKEEYSLKNREILAKKSLRNIYAKYGMSAESKSFFVIIRDFSFWQDKRKENILRLIYCIDRVLGETAKRFKISRTDLSFYFFADLIGLLERNKKISPKELDKRNKVLFFSYFEKGLLKTKDIFGQEADEIKRSFKKQGEELLPAGIIKGFVASAGKSGSAVKGRVKIVLDPENDFLAEGEILVAGMTRPEFVPLMKKAKAIITNEGGITTHAAIISRELKVPCIIGTKIATEILHDGDLIEMDLKNGLVKIIK
jgi:phosphoenolpyruvate synthase/pyruvate phosphate dikinase